MAYLDYSRPDLPDLTQGFREIGDALSQVIQRRQQREEAEKKLQFEREQEQRRMAQQQGQLDYQNRIEDRKQRASELEFSQKQNVYKAQRAEQIRKAVADGNEQLANQLANETVLYDPHTGQETSHGAITRGPARDVGPEPQAPQTQEFPPQEMTAAMAAIPGVGRTLAAPMGEIEKERGAQAYATRRYDSDLQGYRAEQDQAERDRPYNLRFGNEPGQTFDMSSQRYAGHKLAAEDFLHSFAGMAMSESDKNAAAQTAAQIQSGTLDPSKAGATYDKARMGTMQEEGKNNRETAHDKAWIEAMKARGAGDVGWARLRSTEDKDRRKETRGDIKDWLKANGLEAAPKQTAAMDLSLKQIHGNAREQQAALVGMARAIQGDNRFSDQDYRVFVQNGGVGALDQADNTLQRLLDGGFGDQTIDVASKMASGLRAVFHQRVLRAGTEGSDQFVNDPQVYDPRIARHNLEQRLGKENLPPLQGGPPEVNSKRKGKAKAKAKLDDEAMQ